MAPMVTTLSDTTFDEEVGAADEPILVDFWAEWCGPCKMVAPILDEIAEEHDGKIREEVLAVSVTTVDSVPGEVMDLDGHAITVQIAKHG